MKRWIGFVGGVLCAGMIGAAPAPVLDFYIDVDAWLDSCPESMATNKTYLAFRTLGLEDAAVSIVVEDGSPLTYAKIGTTLPAARTAWLDPSNGFPLEAVSGNEFKWAGDTSSDMALQMLDDDLRVRFSGGTLLIAVENRFDAAEALDFDADEACLAKGSIRVGPLLEPLFAGLQKMVDAEEEGLGKAIMRAMLKSLKAAAQSVQDFPAVSFSVAASDPGTRVMMLSLNYDNQQAAADTKAFFDHSDDAWKNPDLSGRQLSLTGLADTPFFQSADLRGSELQIRYQWPNSEDAALLKVVSQAALGSLISFTETDSFPIHSEETMPAPQLGNVPDFDAAQFEKDIRAALFLTSGGGTIVSMGIDYLDAPNVDLLSADVTDVSLLATNGLEVARANSPGSFGYDPARRSGRIALFVEKDQPPPVTASFNLAFEIPTEIRKYTLTKASPLAESGDGGCCLIAMSNSVVSLRAKNLSLREAKVYAMNKEGEYLKHTSSSRSATSYRGEFKGTPSAVELVVPLKTESITLAFEDMASGRNAVLKMPKDPTDSVVTRYTLEPMKTWKDPDMDAIAASTVSLVTNAGWKKNEYQLQFPKPAGVETERLTMKSYLAGVDEWVSRGEATGSSSSGSHFYWDLTQTNAVNAASAVFGEIEGRFRSGVKTYSADVSTNPTPLSADLELPSAWVDKNVAWVEYEKGGRILDIQAYDKTGRRLKRGHRTNSTMSGRGYYFWGLPSRVTVVYAASSESITIPFEIELKEGGLEAIPAVREKIPAFEEKLAFLKEIAKKARGRYGNLLSAFYYAHNSKNEPVAIIPLEVAHSDPVGASVFGYEPKPCNGYYLRKIQKERRAGKETEKKTYTWAGGTFEAVYDDALLLALPADKRDPAILLRWSNVFVNYNDCSDMEKMPSQTSELAAAGWVEIE